jgi:L,D-transpeptidase ErfK/SrfK
MQLFAGNSSVTGCRVSHRNIMLGKFYLIQALRVLRQCSGISAWFGSSRACTLGLALCAVLSSAQAAVFQLPENGDSVLGQIQHVRLRASDTFIEIARVYNVGYNELVAANPSVDPWLPKDGSQIVIPSQYLLPNAPRKGVVVNLAEMRLYYYPEEKVGGKRVVYTFPIGIGRINWQTPQGEFKVIEKMVDPVWTVPASVLAEAAADGIPMPGVVPPGPDNPLGRHALMLDAEGYLIHGTNKPLTIGRRVSHGCLRMYPEDVEQLINKVPRGADVKIIDQPVKVGRRDGVLYLEIHPPLKESHDGDMHFRTQVVGAVENFSSYPFGHRVWERVFDIGTETNGMPVPFAELPSNNNSQNWFLRVESSINKNGAIGSLPNRFGEMALPVFNRQCHPFQTCIDLGPFTSPDLRDATAEMIKYGLGLHTQNIVQNARNTHQSVDESDL